MSHSAILDTPPSTGQRRNGASALRDSSLPTGFSREFHLELFRKTVFNRSFELATAEAMQAGEVKVPIYLGVGQEHIAATLSIIFNNPAIFAQHRAHSYYLSYGGRAQDLADELLGLPSGCAGGRGGSASIHHPGIPMYGHSGLMGDQVPLSVGYALTTGRPTLTVVGDASGEEDYALGAMGYAVTKKAPVLFLCEDNNLSILTPVATRRSWNITEVARSFGMPAVDISDDPWLIAQSVERLLPQLPAYINIRTCRHLWHAGAGCDGEPEWNRFEMIRQTLDELGYAGDCDYLERSCRERVDEIWSRAIAKLHERRQTAN